MLLGWVAVVLMLMVVAAPGLGLVFRAAWLGVRVARLGARVAKDLFFWCCSWAWVGFPRCWAGSLCCSVLLGWVSVSLGWTSVLPKIFLSGAAVSLDWFSMVMGWISVLPMVVAVAARGLGLVFRAAGLGVRVA